MTRTFLIAAALAVFALPAAASEPAKRVEVVSVRGVIDSTVQRSVTTTLRDAAREKAAAVVIEIDSRGSLGAAPVDAIVEAVRTSPVKVVTWITPPGSQAANGARVLFQEGHVRAMAPGTRLGALRAFDLRRPSRTPTPAAGLERAFTPDLAVASGSADILALQLPDLLRELDIEASSVRFRKADLLGRMLHAVMQPSIAYLLLLLALVGIVFEAFHPSTGPAGLTGLFSGALAIYGIAAMGGSWIAVALLVLSAVALSVDLRFATLGVFTLVGVASLIAGSLLLFGSPLLRVHPGVLAFGILGFLAFMLGAMTRVLRDLRALARGEIHPVDPVEALHRDES